MNNKNILKLLVASSTIMGGIGLTTNAVQATETKNNNNENELTQDTVKVSSRTIGKIVNVNSNLNVRTDAGINYDTIGYVCNNQEIEVLSEKGEWYRISFEGREGYVSKKYVSVEGLTSENSTETPKLKGKTVNVNSTLNIRQLAEDNSAILGTLKNGDTFEIISKTDKWYNIKTNNIIGFISSKYVQEITGSDTTIENVIETITEGYEADKYDSKAPTEKGIVVNITSNLRVRGGASTFSETIGYLLCGEEVNIKGEVAGWYKIDFNGRIGYVSKEYIQKGNVQAFGISTVHTAVTSKQGKVVNISSSLNIRSGAGIGHSVVGVLHNGDTVDILERSGDWYHISHNGVNGYVSAQYLKEVSSTGNITRDITVSSKATGKVVNISSTLNVRSGAGTGYSVVGTLKNGDTVDILERSGDWYYIINNGIKGYVSAQYLQKVSEGASTPTPTPAPAESSKDGKVVNISSTLNIRLGAGTGYSVVGTLKNGDIVKILERSGDWYHINNNGVNGYVSAQYLQEVSEGASTPTPAPAPAESSKDGKVVNISSRLNIRAGAGTSYSIVGTLNNGDIVKILERSGDWYHINNNGVNGYVSAQYLQEVSEGASTPTPAPAASSKNGKVVNISSRLNIRSGAGTGHSVVGTLKSGDIVEILERSGDWYHISHNGVNGYVSAQYLQEVSSGSNSSESTISSKKGQVYNTTHGLRVRSAASTNSTVLGYLLNGQHVNIISISNGWVAINYNGRTAYVSAEYIRDAESSISSSQATAIFNEVFNVMKAHIGSPYIWGGAGEYLTTSSLNSLKARFPGHNYSRAERYVNQGYRAFDCSGLMQWGFRQVGITIGRTTTNQIEDGDEVSLGDLRPGDLLFNAGVTHVGMYIGNGQWIESPNSSENIRIVSVPWSKITRARRVIR